MILTILKIIFLFLGVRYTFVNIGRIFCKEEISSSNTFVMTLGIVGFIVLQFKLY